MMDVIGSVPVNGAGLVAALVVAGLVSGFLAGLLGIGGGGVLVPVLYEIFTVLGIDAGVRMHLTLGTTLAVIAPTALRSFAGHRARGSADTALLKRMALWVVFGVVLGVFVAGRASSDALKWVWIVTAIAVAIKLALGRDDWRLGETIPRFPFCELVAAAIGLLSTLMSIGGGTFVVPFLTLYGRPILNAVATAAGVGPLIAIPGAIGYMWAGWGAEALPPLSIGYVSVLAVAIVAPLSVLAAPLGVRVAHGINRRTLELAFAALLATVAVRFYVSLGA